MSDLSKHDGHLDTGEIAQYAEALILDDTGRVPDDIRMHVMVCETCKQEVFGLFNLLLRNPELGVSRNNESLEGRMTAPNRPAKGGSRSRKFYRGLGIAAMIAGVLTLGGTAFYLVRNAGRSERIRKEIADKIRIREESTGRYPEGKLPETLVNGKSHTEGLHGQYAEAMVTNPRMERLLKMHFRVADFKCTSPKRIYRISTGQKLGFSWTSAVIHDATLSVFDASGRTVFQQQIRDHGHSFIISFNPGYYYWVLSGDKVMYYAGRLEVAAR